MAIPNKQLRAAQRNAAPLRRRESIATEAGAHTFSFDAARNIVCAFLPATHRAAVYQDQA